MRKIIRTGEMGWEQREWLEQLLNVNHLPEFVVIETVEEED